MNTPQTSFRNLAARQTDRRTFLKAAGVGVAGIAGLSVLAGCSTSSPAASSTTAAAGKGDFGSVAMQLSWIKNIEFAGEYFADSKGYYKSAGFSSVDLLAGGSATTSPEALVLSNKVLTGLSSPIVTGAAILNNNAPLKIIGAVYQRDPFCILSLKEKTPMATVADLKGKKIGVQTGPNEQIWNGFLKVNNIDPSELTVVPVQYDPTVLATGTVDGYFAYVTDEPIIMKSKGYTPVMVEFADNGLVFSTQTYVASQQDISGKRDMLKAFMKAEVQGWNDAVASPSESASLAVNKYGKDQKLDMPTQLAEAKAQNQFVATNETKTSGVLHMTNALVDQNISALKAMGIKISADQLFDMSLLAEVFKENPRLIGAS